jgi:hypothetical protein
MTRPCASRLAGRLSALLLLLGAAQAAASEARAWTFRVFLDDREIGQHSFTLRGEGPARELRSEARFQVSLLGFTAYRYRHDATERWSGGCLRALASRTDDNGQALAVDWRADDDDCAMSFAYWHPRILQGGNLLNAQTGRFVPVQISRQGEETIEVRGRAALSQRYRLTGPELSIDLWYADGDWVALESSAPGRRRLRYRLM